MKDGLEIGEKIRMKNLSVLAHLLAGEDPIAPVDWDDMLYWAGRHSCGARLFERVKQLTGPGGPPATVWRTLQAAYYAAVVQDAYREVELQRVFSALQAAQVPALLLKGAALAYQVYAQSRWRLTGDLDVLVKVDDVKRAQAVLEELGYCLVLEPPQRFNPFNTAFTGEIVLRHVAGVFQTVVEVHWELIISDVYKQVSRLNLAELWPRAVEVQIGEVRVTVLNREDVLWHTCVHLALHGFTHLKGYLDVALLAASPALDWEAFTQQVVQSRTRIACYFPLWWAQQVFGAAIPAAVLRRLQPGRSRRWLGQWLLRRGTRMEVSTGYAWEHLVVFTLADRLSDWLRMVAWLFFPGCDWLQARYHLRSRWQTVAWVVIHPALVISEGLRSLALLMARRAGTRKSPRYQKGQST